jgi:glycosyltransferase involved in cell wall biosynthesis
MKLDIITPVGPGHTQAVEQAKASVQRAIKAGLGPFSEVRHVVVDDTEGALGRSAARNQAVKASTADWLFFLDADDLLAEHAFTAFAEFIDYDGVWGTIVEVFNGQISPRSGQMLSISSIQELMRIDPYLSIQMGHFIRREIAAENPFDEAMDAGEDFEYYRRVWRHNCVKVPRVFFVNVRGNHSTGPRSADGQQWREAVEKLGFCGQGQSIADQVFAEPAVSLQERVSNIYSTISMGLPALHIKPPHSGLWSVVAGGPTLKGQLKKIRKTRGTVVAMNGTHDFLLKHKIKPDVFIMADPRERNVRFLRNPQNGVIYYISADCHPAIFDALDGYDVRVWYPMGYEETKNAPVQVGGGSTVGLRAFNIGYVLGYRNFEAFGLDGCVIGDHHAYDQPENDGESVKEVFFMGKSFFMTDWQIAQAQNFHEFIQRYGRTFNLVVHGDGIIKHIGENNAS